MAFVSLFSIGSTTTAVNATKKVTDTEIVLEEVQTESELELEKLLTENELLKEEIELTKQEKSRLWGKITKLEGLFSLEKAEIVRLEKERKAKAKAAEEAKIAEAKKKKQEAQTKTTNNQSTSKGREFTATAYCDDAQSQGKWVGQTATGVKPRVGIIAVDPNVIKLGSTVHVEFFGEYKHLTGNYAAVDTGGAIKGNIIDVFFNTRSEVRSFGRRKVKVTY